MSPSRRRRVEAAVRTLNREFDRQWQELTLAECREHERVAAGDLDEWLYWDLVEKNLENYAQMPMRARSLPLLARSASGKRRAHTR